MPRTSHPITMAILAEAEKRFRFDNEAGVLRYRFAIYQGRNPKQPGDILGSRSADGSYRARTWLLGRNYLASRLMVARSLNPRCDADLEAFNLSYVDHREGRTRKPKIMKHAIEEHAELNDRGGGTQLSKGESIDKLRLVTHRQNMVNRKISSANSSGMTGVKPYPTKKRGMLWEAHIGLNNKLRVIGRFSSFASAVDARLMAEIKYYGEHAPSLSRPNHPYHADAVAMRNRLRARGLIS